MKRDTGDILDRYAITKLKDERIQSPDAKREFFNFSEGFKEVKTTYPDINWDMIADLFYKMNKVIWNLESDIRQCKIDGDLVEVGKRAILIREVNGTRVAFKNIVNSLVGEDVFEIKKSHISE